MSPGARRLISVGAAAEMIGISRSAAYEWCRTGALHGATRINGRYYVVRAKLERWLEGLDTASDGLGHAEAGELEGSAPQRGHGEANGGGWLPARKGS